MKTESILPALTGATIVATLWLLTVVRTELVIGYIVAASAVAFAASEYVFSRRRRLSR